MKKKMMLLAALLAMLMIAAVPAIAQVTQPTELEGEAADIEQDFSVTGGEGSDNGNQCVGIDGTANTGNAQNFTGVIQYDSEADDFEFEEVGGNIDLSGTSTTTCDQQVNQAAAAG